VDPVSTEAEVTVKDETVGSDETVTVTGKDVSVTPELSVTVTVMDEVPAPVGAHDSGSEFVEEQPAGSDAHEYE
jgi:hypothetical protein